MPVEEASFPMYGTHGYWCKTKTFPMSCKACGSRIFFFQCDHESRVLFDELGWPWPIHGWPSTPEPTDEELFEALQGVAQWQYRFTSEVSLESRFGAGNLLGPPCR